MRRTSDILIVGGGAAGLCAAIVAARNGAQVILAEQNSRPGKKIHVSGNGKCNITNRHISPDRFHSDNLDFVTQTLKGYGYHTVEEFFRTVGVVLTEGREGKVFPLSYQASFVVDSLVYAAEEAGVEIITSCKVTHLSREEMNFYAETSLGTIEASQLLIASGSSAAPQLGGTDSGYTFALELGHTLIPRYPSLVQLVSDASWVHASAGVKLYASVTLYANGIETAHREGDILFTKYGISGLAILDISREVSTRLAVYEYCELSLDLMPSFSKEQLTKLLLRQCKPPSQKPLSLWLQAFIPKKLVPAILTHAHIDAATQAELNRKEINKLVHTIKHLKLSISDTRGFEGAEVSTGGIDTREIESRTMASKRVKGLYFAGEVIDVDGERGGFNFHFAWVSGIRAGKAMASKEA